MRYDLFSSFHLSIPSFPIPFCFLLGYSHFAFLSNPSSLLFLLPLFSLPPSSNFLLPLSFPSHLTISLLLPSLSPMYALPPFLLFFSSFPFLRPPSFPLPTLYHFSHPLTLFSPSSFPPLSLDSYLSPHCLFVPIIPPNDLPTVFLPISHLVNRFSSFECKGLESTNKWNKSNTSFHVSDGIRLQKYSRIHKNRCSENDVSARAFS